MSRSPSVARVVVLPRLQPGAVGVLPDKISQRAAAKGRVRYALKAARTALFQGPFDVIFAGHPYHAFLAQTLGCLTRAKVWMQAHGIDAWQAPSRSVKYAFANADLVTAVSRYTRRRLLEWAALSPDKVRVLPNTVRPMFSPGPRDEAALATFGLTGAKVILTVARLSTSDAYKGHRRIIKAMAAVCKAEPTAVYAIVGDGDARDSLQAYAEKLGVSAAVRFLGRLDDEDLLALYRSAELFCMPSMKEGFGIVFAEAAAAGLPVIGGNLDGSVDALADGVIGRLIDPRSREALTTAMIEALRRRAPPPPTSVARFSFANFAEHVDLLVRTLAA